MLMPLTNHPEKHKKSLSPIIKEDYPKMISRNSSKKLNNSKLKTIS